MIDTMHLYYSESTHFQVHFLMLSYCKYIGQNGQKVQNSTPYRSTLVQGHQSDSKIALILTGGILLVPNLVDQIPSFRDEMLLFNSLITGVTKP